MAVHGTDLVSPLCLGAAALATSGMRTGGHGSLANKQRLSLQRERTLKKKVGDIWKKVYNRCHWSKNTNIKSAGGPPTRFLSAFESELRDHAKRLVDDPQSMQQACRLLNCLQALQLSWWFPQQRSGERTLETLVDECSGKEQNSCSEELEVLHGTLASLLLLRDEVIDTLNNTTGPYDLAAFLVQCLHLLAIDKQQKPETEAPPRPQSPGGALEVVTVLMTKLASLSQETSRHRTVDKQDKKRDQRKFSEVSSIGSSDVDAMTLDRCLEGYKMGGKEALAAILRRSSFDSEAGVEQAIQWAREYAISLSEGAVLETRADPKRQRGKEANVPLHHLYGLHRWCLGCPDVDVRPLTTFLVLCLEILLVKLYTMLETGSRGRDLSQEWKRLTSEKEICIVQRKEELDDWLRNYSLWPACQTLQGHQFDLFKFCWNSLSFRHQKKDDLAGS